MITIVKSLISWVGGKSKLMWIINLFAPPVYERSLDVFGGSGTVTLNLDCPSSTLKVYNDFNGNLVNLMRCAKNKPLQLINEIGFLALNARDDFEVYKKFIEKGEFNDDYLKKELELTEIMLPYPSNDEAKRILIKESKGQDIKKAAMYYKLLRYSFNSNGETFGGKKCDVRRFFNDIWTFSKSFAEVTIENKSYEALIKQYDRPNAFIYCDPPYFDAEDFYEVCFSKADHIKLHETLANAQGYVMVSYNNSPEIVELYKDFYIFLTTRPNSMSRKEGEMYEELIITNYDPRLFAKYKSKQLNLFSFNQPEGEYVLIHEPKKALKK